MYPEQRVILTGINRKVADRLEEIFKNNRTEYEQKWDDIKLFIEYGMLTDEKFCERAMKFVLVKDTEGKYYTLDEYKTLIEAEQTDKDSNIVYLYSTDTVAQYNYINAATDKGYSVLVMDGQFDSHFIGLLEQKLEKSHFVRVDSDVIDNLIRKEDRKAADLTPDFVTYGFVGVIAYLLYKSMLGVYDKIVAVRQLSVE